jgi:hypothetical protein
MIETTRPDYRSEGPTPARQFLIETEAELRRAMAKWPATHSPHEAYAVIKEELDEFWEEVRKKQTEHNPHAMYEELVHIAAMAAKAAVDVVNPMINATEEPA